MSEPVSVLGGRVFGALPGFRLSDAGPTGMITLKGDLAAAGFRAAAESVFGAPVPETRRAMFGPDWALLWMSTDEVLALGPRAAAAERRAAFLAAAGEAHVLAADVSDARAHMRLEGARARETLAKGAPVDLSPAAFGPGDMRRTRFGQMAAAFWMPEDGAAGTFDLICLRSVGAHVFDWLAASGVEGAEVGAF